ncbi:MAG TPA: CDP-alcohol phosphatidyltransferase family protein [Kofleriaceae bacterium]
MSLEHAAPTEHTAPTEAWLLMGRIDGRAALPAPLDELGGVSHLLRLACEAAMAGCKRVFVIWNESTPLDLSAVQNDRRFSATLTLVSTPPAGDAHDSVLVVRGDRVFHRDMPKAAIRAWNGSAGHVAKVDGAEHDAVFVSTRETAASVAAVAADAQGIQAQLDRYAAETSVAPVPYLGFTAAPLDRAGVRKAERSLVWSLRKSADGIAAKLINRHISLPITYLIRRVPILPNHVTAIALLCAIAGGVVISRGGYLMGAIGMLLVNLGSIVDGIDGELARLRFQFSRAGQWFDTVADDLANIAYTTGIMVSLSSTSLSSWSTPLWAIATTCFVLTQGTQYYLIRVVYNSGDLAAIPWAFQSSEFLSQQPKGVWPWITATAPKMLKRDFAVTVFTLAACLGHVEVPLIGFAGGAIIFFCVFATQFARNFRSLPRRA